MNTSTYEILCDSFRTTMDVKIASGDRIFFFKFPSREEFNRWCNVGERACHITINSHPKDSAAGRELTRTCSHETLPLSLDDKLILMVPYYESQVGRVIPLHVHLRYYTLPEDDV